MNSTAVDERLDTGQRMLAVGLVLGVSLVGFEVTALTTVLPTVTDELGGDSLYGVCLAVYTLAGMVSLVIAGRAADRSGPAFVMTTSLAVFVVGLVVSGVAPDMWTVVAGRTLQGLGAGGFSPVAYMLIKRAFPVSRQPVMFVWIGAGWVVPSLVAPLFAGLVTDLFGWRWVFFGIVPLAVLVGVLSVGPMRRYPPESGVEHLDDQPRSGLFALLAALGAGTFVLALPAANPVVAVVGCAAGIALGLWALVRLVPVGMLTARPGFPALLSVRFLAAATFIAVDGFVPLAADRIHDASPIMQGFVIVGGAIAWTGGQALVTRFPDITPRTATRIGFVLMMAGIVGVAPVLSASWPLWAVFIGWTIGGVGMGVLYNPTTVASLSYAVPGTEGRVSGQVRLIESLGFSIGYAFGGAFVAAADRGQMTYPTAIGISFVCALAFGVVGLLASRGVHAAE